MIEQQHRQALWMQVYTAVLTQLTALPNWSWEEARQRAGIEANCALERVPE